MFQHSGSNHSGRDAADFAGSASEGLDNLPDSIRMFIEHQNRIAGRSVGRRGMDDFQSDDHDGSMGDETPEQKRKRKRRDEELWRMALADTFYRDLWTGVIESLNARKAAIAIKRAQIDAEIARINETEKKLHAEQQRKSAVDSGGGSDGDAISVSKEWTEQTQNDLQDRKEILEAQIEELDRHEKQILDPIARELNKDVPPSIAILKEISERMMNSKTATNPYYPPYQDFSPVTETEEAKAASAEEDTEEETEEESESEQPAEPPPAEDISPD